MVYQYNGILFGREKRKDALTHAKSWMNLESMLSERRQTHKAIYLTIPCTRNVKNRQIHSDCQGLEGGENGE